MYYFFEIDGGSIVGKRSSTQKEGGPSLVPVDFSVFQNDHRFYDFIDGVPVFNPNKKQVPQSVTMRQARLALLRAGLLHSVNSAVADRSNGIGEAARIEWEYSNEVRRDSALIDDMINGIGITNDQVDDLFIAASKI